MKNKKIIYNAIKFSFTSIAKEKPILFFLFFFRIILKFCSSITALYMPKFILDEVVLLSQKTDMPLHFQKLMFFLLSFVVINIVIEALSALNNFKINLDNEKIQQYTNIILNEKAMSMDYEFTESPEAINQINKAKEAINSYEGDIIGITSTFFQIIENIILLLTLILITVFNLPFLIPFQIISLFIFIFFITKNNKVEIDFYSKKSELDKHYFYLFFSLLDPCYGKDIRLFNGEKLIEEKNTDYINSFCLDWKTRLKKSRINNNFISVNNNIRNMLSYIYIGFNVIQKKITIGDFSLLLNTYNQIYNTLCSIISYTKKLSNKSIYFKEFLTFLNYPNHKNQGTQKPPKQIKIIEFKNVSFKYPNSNTYALRDINVTINKGDHISIIGPNGAGKTTFLKLLCRIYDVSEGEILINNQNIKSFDEEEYKELLSIVFQDYKLFALPIDENIFLNKPNNKEKIFRTLKQSGLYKDVSNLPLKEKTVISKKFDNKGIELSGGQSQKLAISRALYRNSSLILLDEPSASLDVYAYNDIFNKLKLLIKGNTAIIVSHKLSTCRTFNKIIVFEKGKIKETGTHKELLNKQGSLYKKMFEEQAKYY